MSTQLNNLAFFVNGDQIPYEADSLEFQDGFGQYNVRNVVVGGQETQQVFSEDIKTKFGMLKVSIPTTVLNVQNARDWKVNLNNNVLEVNGMVDGQPFSRIFTQASIENDPPIKLATEGSIELEFKSNKAQ